MVYVPTIIFKFKQNGALSIGNLVTLFTEKISYVYLIPKVIHDRQSDIYTVSIYLPSYTVDTVLNTQLLEFVHNHPILSGCVENPIQL